MDIIYQINDKINGLVWGPYMIFLLVGAVSYTHLSAELSPYGSPCGFFNILNFLCMGTSFRTADSGQDL